MNKEIEVLKSQWKDEPWYHQRINERFAEYVNGTPELKAHRDFVEQNAFGFGERSFWWAWALILAGLPKNPSLLEIGVFKSATLSLWRLLREDAKCFGITPLDTSGGVWESDYAADIQRIHEGFNLPHPHIFHGRSDNPELMRAATGIQYDVVYIDGDHSYEGAMHDLVTYAPCVKKGGFLVIDDACNDLHMPFGFFQGIDTVTQATLAYMAEHADEWEFQFNVVHLRIYKRK